MLPAPCYVFSDAHLGAAAPDAERGLLTFLRSLGDRAGSLVINGDLFDFWFEWRSVMPRGGYRILAALADLRERGVPVLYVAGNHDCWGGEILRDDVGVDFHVGPWVGTLGGWNTRLEHGDGLRAREDRPYRALRRVLRHPLSVRAFRMLHPDLASRMAMGSSNTSRAMSPGDGGRGLRSVALQTLDADPTLDLLVYGHSHALAFERAPTGAVYANPGAWFSGQTYLRVDARDVGMYRWLASTGQGERFDVLERRPEEVGGHARELLGTVGNDESVLGRSTG